MYVKSRKISVQFKIVTFKYVQNAKKGHIHFYVTTEMTAKTISLLY